MVVLFMQIFFLYIIDSFRIVCQRITPSARKGSDATLTSPTDKTVSVADTLTNEMNVINLNTI